MAFRPEISEETFTVLRQIAWGVGKVIVQAVDAFLAEKQKTMFAETAEKIIEGLTGKSERR
jgi:hypothetical protein